MPLLGSCPLTDLISPCFGGSFVVIICLQWSVTHAVFLPSLESGWEQQAVLCMATKFNPNQTFELLPLSTKFRTKTPDSFSCMMKWWLSDTLTTYTVTIRNVCETNREEACQWKAALLCPCRLHYLSETGYIGTYLHAYLWSFTDDYIIY